MILTDYFVAAVLWILQKQFEQEVAIGAIKNRLCCGKLLLF
jgi:hypothetical protein